MKNIKICRRLGRWGYPSSKRTMIRKTATPKPFFFLVPIEDGVGPINRYANHPSNSCIWAQSIPKYKILN